VTSTLRVDIMQKKIEENLNKTNHERLIDSGGEHGSRSTHKSRSIVAVLAYYISEILIVTIRPSYAVKEYVIMVCVDSS
jgi:hypothetical protein